MRRSGDPPPPPRDTWERDLPDPGHLLGRACSEAETAAYARAAAPEGWRLAGPVSVLERPARPGRRPWRGLRAVYERHPPSRRPPCPWYLSAHAVRRYLEITGRPMVDDGPTWRQAEAELEEIAIETVASSRRPKPARIQPGAGRTAWLYRGPKPLRLTLVVSTDRRPEGDLPQLVDVISPRG